MSPKFSQQIPQNGGRHLLPPQPWRRRDTLPTGQARWKRLHGRQRTSPFAVQPRPGSPPPSAAATAGLASRPGLGGLDREDAGTSRPRLSTGRVAGGRGDRLEAEAWRPDPRPAGSLDEDGPPKGRSARRTAGSTTRAPDPGRPREWGRGGAGARREGGMEGGGRAGPARGRRRRGAGGDGGGGDRKSVV